LKQTPPKGEKFAESLIKLIKSDNFWVSSGPH